MLLRFLETSRVSASYLLRNHAATMLAKAWIELEFRIDGVRSRFCTECSRLMQTFTVERLDILNQAVSLLILSDVDL